MDFNEIINEIGLNDFIIICFFIGYIWCMLIDIINSFINYVNEKAWSVSDYEKVIYNNLNTYDCVTNKEKRIIIQAINNYEKRLTKRKRINNFIQRIFKRNKK